MTALALSGCGTPQQPEPTKGSPRVVALGYLKDADASIAIGIVPVAMPDPGARQKLEPWTRDALGVARPELINMRSGVPLERIAALKPDVILATGYYELDNGSSQMTV